MRVPCVWSCVWLPSVRKAGTGGVQRVRACIARFVILYERNVTWPAESLTRPWPTTCTLPPMCKVGILGILVSG